MSLKTKTLLLCGATGFIGRNALEYFAKTKQYKIRAIYHERPPLSSVDGVEWVQADLRNISDIKKIFQDLDQNTVVIQAAATTSVSKDILNRPHIHITDNAVINSLLFREAFDRKVEQVVFFSCSIMYQNSDIPLKESDLDLSKELEPKYFGPSWTKIYLEKMAEFYSRHGETKFSILRHTNIYGPYDKFDLDRSHFFGATVTKVLKNESGTISVWGKGEEKRDLLYVEDLIEAISLCLKNQKNKFELLNISYEKAFSVNEVVQKIIHYSKKTLKVEHDLSKPSIPTSLTLSSENALKTIGWKRRNTLDEGIQKTIEWYQRNLL